MEKIDMTTLIVKEKGEKKSLADYGLKAAPLKKRFIANVIDFVFSIIWVFIVVSSSTAVLTVASEAFKFPSLIDNDLSEVFLFGAIIITFFVLCIITPLLYYLVTWLFEAGKGRASIGKKIMRIHWVEVDGSPLSKKNSWKRIFASFIYLLVIVMFSWTFTVLIIIAIMYMIASNEVDKQMFYDKWANAYLVEK